MTLPQLPPNLLPEPDVNVSYGRQLSEPEAKSEAENLGILRQQRQEQAVQQFLALQEDVMTREVWEKTVRREAAHSRESAAMQREFEERAENEKDAEQKRTKSWYFIIAAFVWIRNKVEAFVAEVSDAAIELYQFIWKGIGGGWKHLAESVTDTLSSWGEKISAIPLVHQMSEAIQSTVSFVKQALAGYWGSEDAMQVAAPMPQVKTKEDVVADFGATAAALSAPLLVLAAPTPRAAPTEVTRTTPRSRLAGTRGLRQEISQQTGTSRRRTYPFSSASQAHSAIPDMPPL